MQETQPNSLENFQWGFKWKKAFPAFPIII
jgi:hypothetical protein